jgi:hypothetical protein
MHAPVLTIGLPVFNGERYLAEALGSILGQDFRDFQLVVSDNASTDGTAAIVLATAHRDSRVRYVRQPVNRGAAVNFNHVFLSSTTPYFKWACADDVVAGGFLRSAVAELDAHPEAVLCYGETTLISAEGVSLGAHHQGLDLRMADVTERFRKARDHRGLLNVLHGVLRSDALRRTGLMGRFPGSDEALMVELALLGAIHEIPYPMLGRRMHAGAAHATMDPVRRQTHLDPAVAGAPPLYYSRRAIAHLRAISRLVRSARTRARLTGIVLRSAMSERDKLAAEAGDATRYLVRRLVGDRRVL